DVQPFNQNLECAEISFVCEFRIEHVKSHFIGFRPVSFGSDELEPSVGIDKSSDQPGGSDPVHMNTFSRDPRAGVVCARALLRLTYGRLADFCLPLPNERIRFPAFGRSVKVDGLDLAQPLTHA